MRRRDFLLRLTGMAAGITLARRAAAQLVRADSAAAAPADSAATADSARTMAPGVARIAAAGDTTLGYNLEAHFDQQLAAGVPREALVPLYFAHVKPLLAAADLALVNLECPFTTSATPLPKNFNFRARPELVEILKAGAVSAVTLANNHLKDYGDAGVTDTIATLDAAGIGHFGAGATLDRARAPLIVERNGVRFGFLGYYFQAEPDMLEPKEVYATRHSAGVAGCYKELQCMKKQLREDVARLHHRVDAVIPFFHWGHEGSTEVRDYQIELAHLAVDRGCRAVLGAHPHRFQGVEVYRGAPIFYSLGNFVFGGNKDPVDKLSAIVRLTVPRRGPVEADLVPVQITRWPEAPFQPFPLEGAEQAAALARIADLSRGFAATLAQLAAISASPPAIPAAPAATDTAGTRWR